MPKRFRLYIDESGDHTYGKRELRKLQIADKKTTVEISSDFYPGLKEAKRRYLGLTGCIIETQKYRVCFHPELEKLKQKHFPHSPDEPVIFHRNDIVYKHGPFRRLMDYERRKFFDEDLLVFFSKMEYTLITVVIDKKSHIERYGKSAFHPYHYCLAVILEQYCGFLNFYSARGDVLAESRGGSEDAQLKEAYRRVYNGGTYLRSAASFQSALTSKEIKLKPKKANLSGLQLADLLAHPSKEEILIENGRLMKPSEKLFGDRIREVIRNKYNKQIYSGKAIGYGKIFL